MKKIALFLSLLLITLATDAQSTTKLPTDPNVRYGKLSNGMTYYVRHNAYPEKKADFYIAQRVGSIQEEDSQMGLAHFLEHMAFNGTKHYPGRKTMLNYLETNGAKFGTNVNAYTSFDETVYTLNNIPVPREGIVDSCLLVLHDWSSYISLENEEIDKERLIIKEEWRTRGSAQMRIWEKQLPVIYAGSKYANRLPIGTMEVVENFDYQTLKDYYHKWYRPDLQAIIIVGDIDADKVEAKIKTLFSKIPAPVNPAKREEYPVPDNDKPIITITIDPEATRTNVSVYMKHDVMPKDEVDTEGGYLKSVLRGLASQMISDRMSELAKQADAPFMASYIGDGDFFVSKTKSAWTSIAISKEGRIPECLSTLIRENERVRRFGFTQAETERAKANLLQGYENSYNNRNKQQTNNYTEEYKRNFISGEPFPGMEFEYEFIKKALPLITAESVSNAVKDLISDKNMVIAVSGPEKEGLTYPSEKEILDIYNKAENETITAYQEVSLDKPLIENLPKAGNVTKVEKNEVLGVTLWTLSNGMKVAYKKTDFKDDEVIMTSYAFGGTSNIPDNDIFNANMAGSVVGIGGLGNFSATDLKKVLSGKSAYASPSISAWGQGINGSSNMKDLETLFQLTHLIFTSPRKDEGAFSTAIDSNREHLKNKYSNPSAIFQDTISYTMYPGQARAKPMGLKDLDNIKYDRVIEIYKQMFANPGNFTFTFVGTIDENILKPLVEKYLGSLPSGNAKTTYDLNTTLKPRKGKYTKRFEQAMKNPKASVIDMYTGKMNKNLKNDMAFSVLKQILDMVYTQTVREDEGGTYGVAIRTSINRIPEGEAWIQMFYDTNPDKVETIHPIIDRELRKIAENGPNDSDLQKVKEYMTKSFEEGLKKNGYWMSTISHYYLYNEDNHSNYAKTLESLSKDDIKAITKEFLSQGNLVEVIMTPEKD